MRIAFQNGSVHECTRVAFVSITYQVLFIARTLLSSIPLEPRRESSTASSSQSGDLDLFDHFFRLHGSQHLLDSLVSVYSDIILDVFRIDHTAVSQNDSLLFADKFLVLFCNGLIFCHLMLHQMLLYDLFDLIRLYLDVSRHFAVVIIYVHDRFQITSTYASGHSERYIADILFCDLFFKFRSRFLGTCGNTAAALSDYYSHTFTS